ncbi:MAG TPA: LacI family DNA-binding transcriptional regulator [Candidatus Limnocylindrales bacterium]|nr:LacI family DNA-binding transcriptional regulator [Candidatus Limnocylindrales bacterium]
MRERKPTRRVSVKDVAARSGVSFQTTSKVLNGGGSVSDVTRARILQAASDLGYVPNLQARSLVMQRTLTVGLIAGDFSDPGLSRCLAGAEAEARRQGYGLMLTSIEPEGSGTEYAMPAMMERRVDGILLAAPQMEDDPALPHVLDPMLPIVSINHIAGGAVTEVTADDEQAGDLATRHLVARGHSVIGALTGVRGRRLTQSRQRGYRKALDHAQVDAQPELVEEAGDDVTGGEAALRRLIERRQDVTAIFCHHDLVAVGALSALRALGRRVPQDCAVVGCDGLDSAAYTSPPLTTVRVPFYEIGAEAMRVLLKMIGAGTVGAPPTRLPVHLMVRSTT